MKYDMQIREKGSEEWLDYTNPGDVTNEKDARRLKQNIERKYPNIEVRIVNDYNQNR